MLAGDMQTEQRCFICFGSHASVKSYPQRFEAFQHSCGQTGTHNNQNANVFLLVTIAQCEKLAEIILAHCCKYCIIQYPKAMGCSRFLTWAHVWWRLLGESALQSRPSQLMAFKRAPCHSVLSLALLQNTTNMRIETLPQMLYISVHCYSCL